MIEISHITKCFGKKTVLDDFSLDIHDDQIYGLIGYNGVGKTTLLKLMNGIYRPDGGCVKVDGAVVFENAKMKQNIFLMTEELFLLQQASISDMANFYRGYYPGWDQSVCKELADLFGLDMQQKISGFSKGMLRQVGILTAFSSGCKYLFLDEAFDGLDLGIRLVMRQILKLYVRKKNATVVLTSHNLEELEECADRFGMICDGKRKADMKISDLHQEGMRLEEYFLAEQKEKDYDLEKLFAK